MIFSAKVVHVLNKSRLMVR